MGETARRLAAMLALAIASGANGCTTCGTNPEGEAAANRSTGEATEREAIDDAMRDSEY